MAFFCGVEYVIIGGVEVRKLKSGKSNIVAYLDDYQLISVYLSKYYYEGKSSVFRLRDYRLGTLTNLDIIKTYESRQGDDVVYKLKANKPLVVGEEYDIVDAYGLSCPLVYGRIVRLDTFDQQFSCPDAKLGAIYTKEKTIFRVWAPTATKCKVEYVVNNQSHTHRMQRKENGIYEAEVYGDLDGVSYTYLVRNSEDWQQAIDPYAYSSLANATRSVVIDPNKIQVDLEKDKLPPFKQYTDAIIYELSVRDFTMMNDCGFEHRGKFLGLIEEGTHLSNGGKTGLDYLKELGVTHLQLMPIGDFGTVDEDHPEAYYNWGYDPIQYSVPEGSYATDARNPYARVLELKQMIAKLHECGFRVIMDVVYNHMFDRYKTAFEKIVPSYYFRHGKNGELSNGSFCGNDMATDKIMMRKYIVESCLRWVEEYGVDGFRFDLMGIIDIETMNQVVEACRKVDENLMFYGEGWNMPTILPDEMKSMIDNHQKLPYIAFFNDRFRNIMRGPNGAEHMFEKGYTSGNTYLTHDAALTVLGCDYLTDPWRSLNYIECHDNETFWDKLKVSNYQDTRALLYTRMNISNAMVLLSLGVPFLHSGQEFCRTKFGEHNTYNRPDSINQINWYRKQHNIEQVNFVKDMIKIRKMFPCFRIAEAKVVEQCCKVEEIDYRMLVITYDYEMDGYDQVKVFFNPSEKAYPISLGEGTFELVGDLRGYVGEILDQKEVIMLPISLMIVAKKRQ